MQNEIQQASSFFFLPLAAAYLTACGVWLLVSRRWPALWPPYRALETDRRHLDFAIALAAAAGILLLGAVYRAGWLPRVPEPGWRHELVWVLDNLIIYSPIWIALALRRQPPRTVFLAGARLGVRAAVGLALALLSVVLFLAMRGEIGRLPAVLGGAVSARRIADFVPVFLEGVALAFVFVRLRWTAGRRVAVLLPALLFALAHVPGELAQGRAALEIAAFFAVNTVLVAAILDVARRSQDIVWLGIVHYLMDIAIGAI